MFGQGKFTLGEQFFLKYTSPATLLQGCLLQNKLSTTCHNTVSKILTARCIVQPYETESAMFGQGKFTLGEQFFLKYTSPATLLQGCLLQNKLSTTCHNTVSHLFLHI